jgi:hypothetical protein
MNILGKTARMIAFTAALLILAAAAGFALRGTPLFDRPVTLTSLSPDNALRVVLIERPGFDRNFELRLEQTRGGHSRTVYRSPDEGRPAGSERIVWSADSTRFVLLGRHFFVTERGKLPTGEQAYLMMDVRSGQAWCNAAQQSGFPGMGAGMTCRRKGADRASVEMERVAFWCGGSRRAVSPALNGI